MGKLFEMSLLRRSGVCKHLRNGSCLFHLPWRPAWRLTRPNKHAPPTASKKKGPNDGRVCSWSNVLTRLNCTQEAAKGGRSQHKEFVCQINSIAVDKILTCTTASYDHPLSPVNCRPPVIPLPLPHGPRAASFSSAPCAPPARRGASL